eukprot:2861220-Rhodomonas_salina.1
MHLSRPTISYTSLDVPSLSRSCPRPPICAPKGYRAACGPVLSEHDSFSFQHRSEAWLELPDRRHRRLPRVRAPERGEQDDLHLRPSARARKDRHPL